MNDKYLNQIQDRYVWSHLTDDVLPHRTFEEVLKFHQSTTSIPLKYFFNPKNSRSKLKWTRLVEGTDILPKSIENETYFSIEKYSRISSIREYDKNFEFSLEEVGQILYGAFGRGDTNSSKRYASAGALYPVIPLLLILKENSIKGISSPGSYVFDSTNIGIIPISKWDYSQSSQISRIISHFRDPLSNTAVAYAIDMKRTVAKYGKKGYRHAMIEVGAMSQCFRERLKEINTNYGDCSWSGFSDNALTNMCGLNVRLSPIVLVQWFGMPLSLE